MKALARGCRPRSRTLSSESASQMRQRDLSVTHVPVVRDLRTEGIEARDLRGVVRDRRAVRDDGIRMADTLEAIPDVWRNGDERVVALADEELLELTFGRGAIAIVEEDELDRAVRDGVVDGHPVMQVPAFDDTRVHGREIDLPEPFEVRVVRAEHVHDLPALVRDLPERDDADALDHGFPPRYERYHPIVDRRPSSSDTRAFHPRTRFAFSVE